MTHPPIPEGPEAASAQIEIMRREAKADESEHRGLMFRPGYQDARRELLAMGSGAVPALIDSLEQGFERAQEIVTSARWGTDAGEEVELPVAIECAAMAEIRSDVVELLGEIADPRAVEPLARVFNGPVVPPAAVQVALGKMHTPESKAVLLGAFDDPSRASFGAQGLYYWKRGDPDVIAALLHATDESDSGLARQAIHSLVNLRAMEAVERLTYLSSLATDDRLREKARAGLAALRG